MRKVWVFTGRTWWDSGALRVVPCASREGADAAALGMVNEMRRLLGGLGQAADPAAWRASLEEVLHARRLAGRGAGGIEASILETELLA